MQLQLHFMPPQCTPAIKRLHSYKLVQTNYCRQQQKRTAHCKATAGKGEIERELPALNESIFICLIEHIRQTERAVAKLKGIDVKKVKRAPVLPYAPSACILYE